MTTRVRIVVPARNEERRVARMLHSVEVSLRYAMDAGADWQHEVVVVLDRCTDRTALRAHGATLLRCPAPFGKVEALRAGMQDADLFVCIDADVVLGPRTLFDLVQCLVTRPEARACCPPLRPEPLTQPATPLAWALHRYNDSRGFSSERLWLSGRCYALRPIAFPTAAELARRAGTRAAPPLGADDVWLSRELLAQDPRAIVHVDTDPVWFRAPSTLRGMSRTYRRLRRELARVDALFPELPSPGRDRKIDRVRNFGDRVALRIFDAALLLCRAHAWLEAHTLGATVEPWPVVLESKT